MERNQRVSSSSKPKTSPLRGDIEGLRAIAVLMVLFYHARIPGISGGFAGVDVFFVISGFLITSLLVREVQLTGSISIPKFYARRARRLLPAATVVLVATGMVGFAVFPALTRAQLGSDILASTFYVVNWSLAARSVDYLAEDAVPSAVQHYWSLSVEEQFYVIWPLIMIAAVILARRTGGSRFRWMGLSLAAITGASLVWSIINTQSSPGTAYFVTTTRVWELGFGAMLAFGVTQLQSLPRMAAEALSAAGLVVLAVAAIFVSTDTPWPGLAALLPVLGTTAVIAAGCSRSATISARLLGVRPMRFIGGISYSLYLWHWPLLVFMDELRPGTGLRGRIAVLGLAVVLAYGSKILIEDPIRFSAPLAKNAGRALVAGAVAMSLSAGVAVAAIVTVPTLDSDLPSWAPGARALMVDPNSKDPKQLDDLSPALSSTGQVYPQPDLAPEDVPKLYDEGCQVGAEESEVVSCDFGDTTSGTVVAVVGDSKIGQWLPALDVIGKQEGWLIRTYTKSACTFADAELSFQGGPYEKCNTWAESVMKELKGSDKPMIVLTSSGSKSGSREGSERGPEALVAGYDAYWTELQDAGVGVVALADNGHPGTEVYKCVEQNPDDFAACDFPSEGGGGTMPLKEASEQVAGSEFIDLTSWLCPKETCPAVIGKVLVYRQGSHITASYIETLAPVLRARLVPAVKSTSASAESSN